MCIYVWNDVKLYYCDAIETDRHWRQQPKSNVNTAAITAWESRKLSKPTRTNKSKRKNRRSKRLRSKSSVTHDNFPDTHKPQSQPLGENASRQTTLNNSANQTRLSNRADIQSSSLGTPSRPDATVQPSQCSNTDRDLYIAYVSSLSTQANSSSLAPHSDSGIGESSPEPEVLQHIEKDGIIPDSQSLPGSSSYIPSTSATFDDTVAQQTPLEAQDSVFSAETTPSKVGFFESSAALKDSIEDSLILEVAASQSSSLYRRLRSEPPPSSTQSRSSSGSHCPSLLRSKSDSAASYSDQVQCPDSSVSRQSRRAQDILQRVHTSSSISGVHLEQDPAFREGRPHWSVPVSQPGSKVTSQHSSIFQSQVPFVPASQATRTSTEATGTFGHASVIAKVLPKLYLANMSEESLQARESAATLDIPATQISSESSGSNSHTPASIEIIPAIVCPARRRPTTAGVFEI